MDTQDAQDDFLSLIEAVGRVDDYPVNPVHPCSFLQLRRYFTKNELGMIMPVYSYTCA